MKQKILMLITLLLLGVGTALGQTITAKGRVVDENNEGVPTATVRLKSDAKKGTFTDMDGNFVLETKQGDIILISFVGYKDMEVAAQPNMGTIKLVPDQEILDEVVVVGYGKSTKRSFTGSAVTVKSDALEKKSISNLSQALSGEVPGVTVVNTSGQPGTSADIYVRGVGSINASTAPLYVVDGVPFSGNIASINPADIESTTLLKDAASTAIYGARGANGVILINTKSGKSGKINISADFKYGVNTLLLPRHEVIKSPDEYMEIGWSGLNMFAKTIDKAQAAKLGITTPEAFASENIFGTSGINADYNYFDANPTELFDANGKLKSNLVRKYTPENWEEHAFQPSNRLEGNVQMAGGSEGMNAFASMGYLKDVGISKNSSFERYTGRINVDMRPSTWLQTKGSLAYTHSISNASGQSTASSANLFSFIDHMPPIYPLFARDEKGEKIPSPYYKGEYEFDYGRKRAYSSNSNGLANAVYDTDVVKRNQLTYNLAATVRFLDGFSFENTFSGMYDNYFNIARGNMWYGDSGNRHGSIFQVKQDSYSYNILSILRYINTIGDGHNLEAFVAHEAQKFTQGYSAVSKKNLVNPFSDDLGNALEMSQPASGDTDGYSMESYFAQVNYDYKNKYYVSGTFRRDGSSRFLNNKWGNFGSIGLAWVASDEEFLKNNDVINFLKVKASYGSLGQQGGISYYSGNNIYEINNLLGSPSLLLTDVGNPDLTWERTNMFQLGFEMNLLKVLDLNVEFYDKRTSDLIYERRVAPSNGYALYNVNDGLLENYGVDIDLTWNAIKQKDYYFQVRTNAGFVGNRMLSLPIEPGTGEKKYFDDSIGAWGRMKGRSLYDYYMRNFEGVNPDTGLSQWTMYYVDANNNGAFDDGETPISSLVPFEHENPELKGQIVKGVTEDYSLATRYHVGKSGLPVVKGGLTLSGGYKGFDLSLQFVYSLGGYGYDSVYSGLMSNQQVGKHNWHVDIRNRWMTPGQNTNIPRLNNGLDKSVTGTSTRFLISNSFLNFANFRLGYTLPKAWVEKVYCQNVNVWVSGDNLFLISARRGFNPSTSLTGGNSSLTYNPLSTVTAGVRITF